MQFEFCGLNYTMLRLVSATPAETDAALAACTGQVDRFQRRGHNKWDGNVRLAWFMEGSWLFPAGCWLRLQGLMQPDPQHYRPAYDVQFLNPQDFFDYDIMYDAVSDFVDSLQLPERFQDTTDQKQALHAILQYRMSSHHISTGFGKTALAYMTAQWTKQVRYGKTLMIVPRVSLVEQGITDCMEYQAKSPVKLNLYGVCAYYKNYCSWSSADLIVGTYQSLSDMPDDMFADITTVICDEAHTAKSLSVKTTVSKCKNASLVTGISGTMSYMSEADRLNLDSYVGPLILSYKAAQQIDKGRLPKIAIQPIRLNYSQSDGYAYNALLSANGLKSPIAVPEAVQELGSAYLRIEFEYLYTNTAMFNFILQLTKLHTDQGQNALVLFTNRTPVLNLFDMANLQGRKCHMILGGTPTHVRNGIKHQIESEGGWLLVATTGTMAMGVSINNLHAMVTSLIGHSPHTTLQAIGRMLRKHVGKMPITVCYDIYHNISAFGTQFDSRHFAERKKFYNSEDYPVYKLFERNASTYM